VIEHTKISVPSNREEREREEREREREREREERKKEKERKKENHIILKSVQVLLPNIFVPFLIFLKKTFFF
jgi:hypothetical protein